MGGPSGATQGECSGKGGWGKLGGSERAPEKPGMLGGAWVSERAPTGELAPQFPEGQMHQYMGACSPSITAARIHRPLAPPRLVTH